MPNGGVTPDCVHCKFYEGQPHSKEEPFCEYHKIKLPYQIRAFCSNFVDREPVEGADWLDQELDRKELDNSMMYLWLGGYDAGFFHVPLAQIEEYSHWTREKFLEELAMLSDKHKRD